MPLLKKKKSQAVMPAKGNNTMKAPMGQPTQTGMTTQTGMANQATPGTQVAMTNLASMLSPTQKATLATVVADATGAAMANKKPKFSKKKTKA